jgi:hypothetical protein
MERVQQFFMVKRGNSRANPPQKCHHDRESAREEAKRLAQESPGEKFFILDASEYAVVESPAVVKPTDKLYDPGF